MLICSGCAEGEDCESDEIPGKDSNEDNSVKTMSTDPLDDTCPGPGSARFPSAPSDGAGDLAAAIAAAQAAGRAAAEAVEDAAEYAWENWGKPLVEGIGTAAATGLTCEALYPTWETCTDLRRDSQYGGASVEESMAKLRASNRSSRFELGRGKPADSCGDAGGMHYNVRENGQFAESIICCNCCDDQVTGIAREQMACNVSYT